MGRLWRWLFPDHEPTILATLEGREMTGVQIHEATKIGFGSLYPTLFRLEDEGRVLSRWAHLGGARRRRLYRSKP